MNQSRWSLRQLLINILLMIGVIFVIKNCTEKIFFSSNQSQIVGRWQCIEQNTPFYAKKQVTIWEFNQRGELTVIREPTGQSSSGRYFLLSEKRLKIKWRNRDFTNYDISLVRNQLKINDNRFDWVCQKL